MQPLPIRRKWILHFIIIVVALSLATPALADYLGPDRTVTETTGVCKIVLNECQFVTAKNEWRYKTVEDWVCSNESKPWQAYPGTSRPCNDTQHDDGYQYWSREDDLQTVTVTYPPATINSSLQNCSLQNGWCGSTTPQLLLNGNEPLSGQSILLIEGTLNGQPFACPAGVATCNVPLLEGDNSFTYWALSSWGDSSTMGASTAKVDTISPDVSLSLNGASGTNGWYISPVTLTAEGSDATSGVASALLSVNSGGWQPSTTLPEGRHDIAVTASDNAGNISSASTMISVDTTTPAISVIVDGTAGKNGWYRSAIQVSASVSDATSGVDSFEVSADGGGYQSYTSAISFEDGSHTIQFKSIDKAGNTTETPLQRFLVDTIAPTVDLPASWELGRNVPYGVQDDGSGLAALRLVIEDEDERYAKVAWDETVSGAAYSQDINWNGEFRDKTVAPPGTYLVWIKASDTAGNERIRLGKVIVPEPNLFFNVLQSQSDPTEPTPVPPADLLQEDISSMAPAAPALDFGGSATDPQEELSQSVLLATGTSGSVPEAASDVLWGAAAAAAIGAATAYALDERRKREEAEARQAAAARAEMEEDANRRAENLQKQQENWEKKQALEEAQREAARPDAIDAKVGRQEWNETVEWYEQRVSKDTEPVSRPIERKVALQEFEESIPWLLMKAEQERKKSAEHLQEKLIEYYAALPPGEKEGPRREPTTWDLAKSVIKEKVIQPFDTHIYQPLVKPALEARQELVEMRNAWLDEHVYQRYIKPDLDRLKQATENASKWWDEKVNQPLLKPLSEKTTKVLAEVGSWWNEAVYQAHIIPAIERSKQSAAWGSGWINEHLYQPIIKPIVTSIDKTIYQPILRPLAETIDSLGKQVVRGVDKYIYEPIFEPIAATINNVVSKVIGTVDKYIFEPVLKPMLKDINQYIYQPFAQKFKNWWGDYGEWVHGALDLVGFIPGVGEIADGLNGAIYLAEGRYLEAGLSLMSMIPLVGDLGKVGKWSVKAGQEVVDTVVQKVATEFFSESIEKAAKETLNEGLEKVVKASDEWLHTTLSAAGCVPGASTYTAGVNSLLYLANGRVVDATITATSMVPIAGNIISLGKEIVESSLQRLVNKTADELRQMALKESLETGSEILVREAKAESIEKIGKEGGEALIEKSAKETAEETVEVAAKESVKETLEEGVEKGLKEVGEEAAEISTRDVFKEAVEKTADKIKKELKEDAFVEKITEERTHADRTRVTPDQPVHEPIEGTPKRIDQAQFVSTLREKYGDEMVQKFLPFCEKYDINPYEVLSRPLAEGQTLVGWGLDIQDSANPANHPLVQLNLTKSELKNIIQKNTIRPESKVVVLGYGTGDKPYFKLSDEIGGCHLSLPDEVWAPFAKAQANFWVDINTPFIEKGIEDRKIFLFNVKSKEIEDPANVRRFSLPELRLIKMKKNDYVEVSVGEYTAFVPRERLDNFEQDLPANLFETGEPE